MSIENNEIELEEGELTEEDLEQITGGTSGGTTQHQQKGPGGAGGIPATNTALLGSATQIKLLACAKGNHIP